MQWGNYQTSYPSRACSIICPMPKVALKIPQVLVSEQFDAIYLSDAACPADWGAEFCRLLSPHQGRHATRVAKYISLPNCLHINR